MTFFKLTNKSCNHNDFQFHEGLNIDSVPFDSSGECNPGGIYYTSIDFLHKWLFYRYDLYYIWEVEIPQDAKVHPSSYNEETKWKADKWKADKLILKNCMTISDFLETNYDICLDIVRKDPGVLHYVNNQTKELCLAAVQKWGNSLYFVKNQTPEICLSAVQQCGNALFFVKDQTPEICTAAIQQNENAKCYVVK